MYINLFSIKTVHGNLDLKFDCVLVKTLNKFIPLCSVHLVCGKEFKTWKRVKLILEIGPYNVKFKVYPIEEARNCEIPFLNPGYAGQTLHSHI